MRRFQFSLRSLLFLAVVIAFLLALHQHFYARHDRLVAALEKEEMTVLCDFASPEYLPSWLRNWLPQKVVYLQADVDSDDDIELINQCPSLKYLSLTESTANRKTLLKLATFSECRLFEASIANMNDCEFEAVVKSLPNVVAINIEGANITPQGLTAIVSLQELNHISLGDSLITEEAIKVLANCHSLESVELGSRFDEQTVRWFIEYTDINRFVIPYGSNVSDELITLARDSGLDIHYPSSCGVPLPLVSGD